MTRSIADLNVSRETVERLEIYAELLRKWNSKINLVAPSTIEDLWTRHFADSAQLLKLAPARLGHWADLGTGGGFPGLIIALLLHEQSGSHRMTLVESDGRKSAFLRTVLRETGVKADVITDRIENVPPLAAAVVSARALAPLTKLLEYADRHLGQGGLALLQKGQAWEKELRDASSEWHFNYHVDKSVVQENSVILSVTGVRRV
ncbi:16S rRNA (guanine(527)-N(7))-methyltransferase RsmG [Roseovarius sp. D22-M7]|uniref:16S rRNA (guanine(527)-N(7))-methyltransferase RsmG n=1 Tax=Roseovarius sp. D22-M7 TaxID=3127116 RepID=UPI00300FC879